MNAYHDQSDFLADLSVSDIDLMSSRVFNPKFISFSTAQLKITTTSFVFSRTAVAELNYPKRVFFFGANDSTILVITGQYPAALDNFSVPFFDRTNSENPSVTLRDKELVKRLRKHLEWDDKAARRVKGILYKEKGMLVFDLTKATAATKGQRKDYSLDDYPRLSDIISTMRPLGVLPSAGG